MGKLYFRHKIRTPKPKKQKYNNIPSFIDGIRFASKKEGKRYQDLVLLQKAGNISDLKLQPVFKFPMGFEYRADFSYKEKGKLVVEDTKGVKTDVFKLKEKCFYYFYPGIQLIIL